MDLERGVREVVFSMDIQSDIQLKIFVHDWE